MGDSLIGMAHQEVRHALEEDHAHDRTPKRVSRKLTIGGMIEYHRSMNSRPSYPTDLSDHEWSLITHLVPEAKPGGRPEAYPKREILNAIFYLLRSGCSWRM